MDQLCFKPSSLYDSGHCRPSREEDSFKKKLIPSELMQRQRWHKRFIIIRALELMHEAHQLRLSLVTPSIANPGLQSQSGDSAKLHVFGGGRRSSRLA